MVDIRIQANSRIIGFLGEWIRLEIEPCLLSNSFIGGENFYFDHGHENIFRPFLFLDRMTFTIFLYSATLLVFLFVPFRDGLDKAEYQKVARLGVPVCIFLFGLTGLYNYLRDRYEALLYLIAVLVLLMLSLLFLPKLSAMSGIVMFPVECTRLAKGLLAEAERTGVRVADAKSCTGGLIAGCLTEIGGSSSVVDRGYVVYDNRAKMEMLGVREATLAAHGAVSEETAREMVAGALARSGCGLAVAVTGIAGPGGGSAEKPVGLVHIAAGRRGGSVLHHRHHFPGRPGRDPRRYGRCRALPGAGGSRSWSRSPG